MISQGTRTLCLATQVADTVDIPTWLCQQVAAEDATQSHSTISSEVENEIWVARLTEADQEPETDSAYCGSTSSIATESVESWSEATCKEDGRIYHKYGWHISQIPRSQLTAYKVVRLCSRRRPWNGPTRPLVCELLFSNLSPPINQRVIVMRCGGRRSRGVLLRFRFEIHK